MSFFCVELKAQVNKLLFEIKLQLSRNKQTPKIRTIYISFIEYDRQVSGKIRTFNFEHALNANDIFFKIYELQVFQKAFNDNGYINWFNFLSHLKQPMGPLRRQLVQHIFDSMNQQKRGSLSTSQLMIHFNPNQIEAFKLGRKQLEEIHQQFLSMLIVSNDEVTREEFINYYHDVNFNFAHNDVFFRYVSNQRHYTPEKIAAVEEEQIRAAIKNIRFKLIEKPKELKMTQLSENSSMNMTKKTYFTSQPTIPIKCSIISIFKLTQDSSKQFIKESIRINLAIYSLKNSKNSCSKALIPINMNSSILSKIVKIIIKLRSGTFRDKILS